MRHVLSNGDGECCLHKRRTTTTTRLVGMTCDDPCATNIISSCISTGRSDDRVRFRVCHQHHPRPSPSVSCRATVRARRRRTTTTTGSSMSQQRQAVCRCIKTCLRPARLASSLFSTLALLFFRSHTRLLLSIHNGQGYHLHRRVQDSCEYWCGVVGWGKVCAVQLQPWDAGIRGWRAGRSPYRHLCALCDGEDRGIHEHSSLGARVAILTILQSCNPAIHSRPPTAHCRQHRTPTRCSVLCCTGVHSQCAPMSHPSVLRSVPPTAA